MCFQSLLVLLQYTFSYTLFLMCPPFKILLVGGVLIKAIS